MSKPEKDSADQEIKRIAEDPGIGEGKKAISGACLFTSSNSRLPSICLHIGWFPVIWNSLWSGRMRTTIATWNNF